VTKIHRSQRVSVVIPVKDDGVLLRRCLRALELQTRPADELIVVDNASRDDSAGIARSAGARVVRCDQSGIAAASAAGYDEATNEVILRLDADCLPARTWIEEMTKALVGRPGVAAVTGGARFIDGPRSMRSWAAAVYLGAYFAVTVPTLGHLPLFGSNLAFRRTAWRDIRHRVHLDADIHDDLDLAYHFGDRYYIRFVPTASMGISMRPLASARGLLRRTRRGVRTVLMHWPRDFPPLRWNRFVLRKVLLKLAILPRHGKRP
jgi:glycosyltransferase involved in cell wall biosynthesis